MSTELTLRHRYPRTTSNASSIFDGATTDANDSASGDSISAISILVSRAGGAKSNGATSEDSGLPGQVSCIGNGAAD